MNKQTEALSMAIAFMETLTIDVGIKTWNEKHRKETINACKEALEQPAQMSDNESLEPVACPYPCGWQNLYSIIIEEGSYLVQHFDLETPPDERYWRKLSSIVSTAKDLCLFAMKLNTHPAPSNGMDKKVWARVVPWQGLSEQEVKEIIENLNSPYAQIRTAELTLKEKNNV